MKNSMLPDIYCHPYWSGGSQLRGPKDTPATLWGGPSERKHLVSTNLLARRVSHLRIVDPSASARPSNTCSPSRRMSSTHDKEVGVCVSLQF